MMAFKARLVPYSVPQLESESFLKIVHRLVSGKILYGKDLVDFEADFARYIGVRHAICFASGRYALFLIYKFFNCRSKRVILPAYTCLPAVDAARWAGAEPFFVDIDLNTYNPVFNDSLSGLDHIGAICLSYLYGLIGDLDPFLEFGKKNNIPVIEDAAIAMGGSYKGQKVGSLGDAAIFSLQSSKILTAWKGGIITTNNEALYQFLREEREKQPNPHVGKLLFNLFFTYFRTLCSNPAFYGLTMYPIKRFVFSPALNKIFKAILEQNPTEAIVPDSSEALPLCETFRFTNIQASACLSSLNRIDSILQKRRILAGLISDGLRTSSVIKVPVEKENVRHAYGRYPVRIPGYSKFTLQKLLLKHGIEIALNYPYISPATYFMKKLNFREEDYPNALVASKETFLLPFHTYLNKEDICLITDSIKNIAGSLT